MEFTVELDEKAITDSIQERLVAEFTFDFRSKYGNPFKHEFKSVYKEVLREFCKQNHDELMNRIVQYAGRCIAQKYWKKVLDECLENTESTLKAMTGEGVNDG